MVYLSKLAKRLALAGGRASGALVLFYLAGCSSPQERDFLSPNPGTTAPTLVGISISPRDVHAAPGEPIHYTATGVTNQGTSVPVTVVWTASGGVIQPDGTFTPDAIGRYRIRATQQGAAFRADSVEAKVYTEPTDILEIEISPDSQEVGTGESLRLIARAELGNGSTGPFAPSRLGRQRWPSRWQRLVRGPGDRGGVHRQGQGTLGRRGTRNGEGNAHAPDPDRNHDFPESDHCRGRPHGAV